MDFGRLGSHYSHVMIRWLFATVLACTWMPAGRGDSVQRLTLPQTPEAHCGATKGTWCGPYYAQTPLPNVAPKRGNKDCPGNCNGVGWCDYDHGMCHCPAGWGGPDCTQARKRPCWRMGSDKRDLGWTKYNEWSHSRCPGICDDDIAMCWCPPESKFGRTEAPAGSPPGTPPVKLGRPLFMCMPGQDKDGNKVGWGTIPYVDLFGPSGWCDSEVPKFHCPCRIEGVVGLLCNIPVEHFCTNQCSGHGLCDQGFCRCHEGWYGQDCSRRRAGLMYEDGDEKRGKPWLYHAITPVAAALDPPITPTRKRPLIYVYDMHPEFNTDILQYRIERSHCLYRLFNHGNASQHVGYYAYAVESALHELFLTSPHRTYDPEEADFFYVPVLFSCLFDVYGWTPLPAWPPGTHGPRPYGAANMQLAAARWLNATFPWFKRRGGRDHIWLTAHDEGACSVYKDIWPGIFLTHWGRMDFPHSSHTSYTPDNYTVHVEHPWHGGDWMQHTSLAHPCYDPQKDMVVPTFKTPESYTHSPYLGAPPLNRTTRVLFRGDVGKHKFDPDGVCLYSRCLRQRLFNMSRDGNWAEKHNIRIGAREDIEGDFSYLLASSVFCLVLPGEGWGHPEDSILHGCIPIIIMDQVHQPFESILDYGKFALRLAEADIGRLPELVASVSDAQVAAMQANLAKVWPRFRYMGLSMEHAESTRIIREHMQYNGGNLRQTQGVQFADSSVDDAFHTVIQWLYSRIDAVRAPVQAPMPVTPQAVA